jgi:hypothetical protein
MGRRRRSADSALRLPQKIPVIAAVPQRKGHQTARKRFDVLYRIHRVPIGYRTDNGRLPSTITVGFVAWPANDFTRLSTLSATVRELAAELPHGAERVGDLPHIRLYNSVHIRIDRRRPLRKRPNNRPNRAHRHLHCLQRYQHRPGNFPKTLQNQLPLTKITLRHHRAPQLALLKAQKALIPLADPRRHQQPQPHATRKQRQEHPLRQHDSDDTR